MKQMRRNALLVGAAAFVIALVISAYWQILDPEQMTRPLSVGTVRAWPDGGSMELELVDAGGRRLIIRRSGSLDVERSKQPLYVVNFIYGVIPIRRVAEKGSALEQQTRSALESIIQKSLPQADREALERLDPRALREVRAPLVGAYDLMKWISQRS